MGDGDIRIPRTGPATLLRLALQAAARSRQAEARCAEILSTAPRAPEPENNPDPAHNEAEPAAVNPDDPDLDEAVEALFEAAAREDEEDLAPRPAAPRRLRSKSRSRSRSPPPPSLASRVQRFHDLIHDIDRVQQ